MAKFSRRRPVVITSIMLLLLGGAFSMYYFYYVPRNEQQIRQYGFSTLRSIGGTLQAHNENQLRLSGNHITKGTFDSTFDLPPTCKWATLKEIPEKTKGDTAAGMIIKEDNLFYYTGKKNEKGEYIALSFSVKDFVGPIVKDRVELFNGYMLIRDSGIAGRTLLFDNSGLAEDVSNILDSSFVKQKGKIVSSISPVTIQGRDYMVFIHPIKLENEKILLCGLLPAKAFYGRANYLPESFLYGVVIVILLLLISLPFLKTYLMGKEERLSILDFLLTISALFVGVTIVTLIIIHWLLMEGGYARARDDLKYLSAQMSASFEKERTEISTQLRFLDNALKDELDGKQKTEMKGEDLLFLNKDKDALFSNRVLIFNPNIYTHFDRVVWADSIGKQVIRGERLQGKPIFIDVGERQYFRVFDTLTKLYGNKIPGWEHMTYLEPINSWVSGEFKIDVSMKSRIPHLSILVMVTDMYSLINTVMPEGYGFCLVDKLGNVKGHSSKGHNLTGNLLDEVTSDDISEAINGRQQKYIKNLLYNGSPYSMYLRPLANSDLFLVTFHDSSYILPVNLRILMFALIFSLITCILVLGVVFAIRYRGTELYRSAADYFSWIVPRLHLKRFYKTGIIIFIGYITLFLWLQFSLKSNVSSNGTDYVVFIWGILSPVNLIFILYSIYVKFYWQDRISNRGRWFFLLAIWLSWLILTYVAYRIFGVNECSTRFIYWCLPFIMTIATAMFIFIPIRFAGWLMINTRWRRNRESMDLRLKKCFTRYKYFVLLLLLAFSALPVSTFTWFAHNIEIIQEVKKQQLHQMKMLEERKFAMTEIWRKGGTDLSWLRSYTGIQYQKGRYNILEDELMILQHLNKPHRMDTMGKWKTQIPVLTYPDSAWKRYYFGLYKVPNDVFRNIREDNVTAKRSADHVILPFYFGLTDKVGTRYYAPVSYPGFDHQASDSSWEWDLREEGLLMKYGYQPDLHLKVSGRGNGRLALLSKYPDRFKFIDTGNGILFLLLFVLLVVCILYQLIRESCNAMFNLKAIRIFSKENMQQEDTTKKELKEIVIELTDVDKRAAFHAMLWGESLGLTPLHRLLLLDMAIDGLINGRNLPEIGQLINKGILCIRDGRLTFTDPTFRAYLLTQQHAPEEIVLRKEVNSTSTWEMLHLPVMIAVIAIAAFIFFTQEDIYRQILAAVTAASTIIPALPKIFGGIGLGGKKAEE